MRLAYANVRYRQQSTAGGHAHVDQFVRNVNALGHELWMWPAMPHPNARVFPSSLVPRLSTLRRMDAIYTRVEWQPPVTGPGRWGLTPAKQLLGSPVVVWEFNTCPEYGAVLGRGNAVPQAIAGFRRHARDCDLAVCVSRKLTTYVQEQLGIARAITVPNGSDPDLFRPDAPSVRRIERRPEMLNVVWIGSADLPWHNFDLLRRAVIRLWDQGAGGRICFHLIGSGVRDLHDMPPSVQYHGAVSYQHLPGWLAAMDVGLCLYQPGPSDFGSPLKLYDYLAGGLTVVGTPQPQVREVFEQLGQTDLLVPHDNPDALATSLLALAADRNRVRAQGAAGRKLIVDCYNWKRAVADTLKAIESLTADR